MDNFININQLKKSELEDILSDSFYFQENFKKNDISFFGNSNVIFLFLEPSTRTKTSFKIACSILGINVIDVSPENSSITKGESIENTLKTLNSYPVDAIVMRSKNHEDFKIAKNFKFSSNKCWFWNRFASNPGVIRFKNFERKF